MFGLYFTIFLNILISGHYMTRFGLDPTDQALFDLETKDMDEKVKKWNFDFREGKPLSGDSDHIYEAVDAETVPSFYHTKTVGSSGVSRSLFIAPKTKTKEDNEKEVKITLKDSIPSTSEMIEKHIEEFRDSNLNVPIFFKKHLFNRSTTCPSLPIITNLPSSSSTHSSPQKRLRKARRSEITPQKRKKVCGNVTGGKRAKRGVKFEKEETGNGG
ncbi:hypothetical protein Mgra_00007344 [Meloidogyne graminicola]|uniref:Cyclin-dependent kinase inhibitor domain-containing protein n=1 Tax=Meloidogyne graminicola TaxID=189291 RepID=A0A8S9ZJ51_9BILA|nr:hypothetical protein Mgra_00007344 [Meloidogyne graminicola]